MEIHFLNQKRRCNNMIYIKVKLFFCCFCFYVFVSLFLFFARSLGSNCCICRHKYTHSRDFKIYVNIQISMIWGR